MQPRSSLLAGATIHVASLDAQACYVDKFDMNDIQPSEPDVTRVYRVMHLGILETDDDIFYDIAPVIHKNASGLDKASFGDAHKCTSACQAVVPVVPVGWEELLLPIYRWWSWHGRSQFYNDGSVFLQDTYDVSCSLADIDVRMELLTTYEQILAIFPTKCEDGSVFMP